MKAQIVACIEELRQLHAAWVQSLQKKTKYSGPLWNSALDELKGMNEAEFKNLQAEQDAWDKEQIEKSKRLEREVQAKGSDVRDQIIGLGAPAVPDIVNCVKEERIPLIAEVLIDVLASLGTSSELATSALIDIMGKDKKDHFAGKIACAAANALGQIGGKRATEALEEVCKRKRLLVFFAYSEPLRKAAKHALKSSKA